MTKTTEKIMNKGEDSGSEVDIHILREDVMSIFANCQLHNQDIPSSPTIVCSWCLGRFDPIASIPGKGPDRLKVNCNTPSHCL